MPVKELLKKLDRIFDLDDKKKKKDALAKILKDLKKKENKLKKSWGDAKSNKDRKNLASNLDTVRKQRKKGVKALRKLKGKE